jgi:hypothetical protein
MRFWSEPHRPPDRLRHACHLGSGDNLARDGVAVGSIHRVWNHKGPHWRGPSLENLFGMKNRAANKAPYSFPQA